MKRVKNVAGSPDRLWHERAGDRQKDIGVLCKYRRDEG